MLTNLEQLGRCGRNKMGYDSGVDKTAQHLRSHVQEFLRRLGALNALRTPCGLPLSLSQAHALMILLQRLQAGTSPRLAELAHALGIDKSNTTRLCQRMAVAGQVRVQPCPHDGRAKLVALTASGRRLAHQVADASHERFESIVHAMPQNKRAQVLRALETLNKALCNVAYVEL